MMLPFGDIYAEALEKRGLFQAKAAREKNHNDRAKISDLLNKAWAGAGINKRKDLEIKKDRINAILESPTYKLLEKLKIEDGEQLQLKMYRLVSGKIRAFAAYLNSEVLRRKYRDANREHMKYSLNDLKRAKSLDDLPPNIIKAMRMSMLHLAEAIEINEKKLSSKGYTDGFDVRDLPAYVIMDRDIKEFRTGINPFELLREYDKPLGAVLTVNGNLSETKIPKEVLESLDNYQKVHGGKVLLLDFRILNGYEEIAVCRIDNLMHNEKKKFKPLRILPHCS